MLTMSYENSMRDNKIYVYIIRVGKIQNFYKKLYYTMYNTLYNTKSLYYTK